MKTWIGMIIILVIIVCAVSGFLYLKHINMTLEELGAKDKAAEIAISKLTDANSHLASENEELKKAEAIAISAIRKLEEERDKIQSNLTAALQQLQVAPPDELIKSIQKNLSTTEIWLKINQANDTEAVFSLAAFRIACMAIEERNVLKFSLLPNVEAQIKEQSMALELKAKQISNLELISLNKEGIIHEKDDQLLTRDKVISKLQKSKLKSNLVSAGVGAGIILLLSLLSGK